MGRSRSLGRPLTPRQVIQRLHGAEVHITFLTRKRPRRPKRRAPGIRAGAPTPRRLGTLGILDILKVGLASSARVKCLGESCRHLALEMGIF